METGQRVTSTVNLGLVAENAPGSRFVGTVPAGTVGTVLDLGTTGALAFGSAWATPDGWRAVRFDGFETADVYGDGILEAVFAPVGPGHVEPVPA